MPEDQGRQSDKPQGGGPVPGGAPSREAGVATGSSILLALAEDFVMTSFAGALAGYPRGQVVGTCADSDEALRLAEELRPDVVLVSANLLPLDGFATVQEMSARVPGVSILMVARDPSSVEYRKALQVGARDMLPIPVAKKSLIEALDAAARVSGAKRSALEKITAAARVVDEPQRATGIVVFSTKGGTGKTFVATNLATGLAARGKKVVLIDLDLQFGDVCIALGMVPERTVYDLVQSYGEFDLSLMGDFMLTHSSGLQVLPAPLFPEQGEQIEAEDVRAVLSAVEGGYDYVIIDTPPFFEERILVALEWAEKILLVGSMDLPTLKNMKLSFSTMDLMEYPAEKLRVVMNRADSRVGLDMEAVEKHLGQSVWCSISSSIEVPKALNSGEVVLLSRPDTRVGRELGSLVGQFVNGGGHQENIARKGLFRRR